MPVVDALLSDLAASQLGLHVPEGDLVAAAIERFARSAVVDSGAIRGAFNEPTVWPATGDWLVVRCLEDGTASYGIAPFAFKAEVENARESCSAIRRVIGE